MGKQFGAKRGLKRHKTPDKFERSTTVRNEKRIKDEVVARHSSPTLSGESSGEESSGCASEEMNYKEPSMYDKLLIKLKSNNKSIADAYQRRKVAEDDETDGSESLSASDVENGYEELDMAGNEKQIEDVETEDDLQTSETDQDEDLSVTGPSAVATSSFSNHVE